MMAELTIALALILGGTVGVLVHVTKRLNEIDKKLFVLCGLELGEIPGEYVRKVKRQVEAKLRQEGAGNDRE